MIEAYYAALLDANEPIFSLVVGYFISTEGGQTILAFRPYEKVNTIVYSGCNAEYLGKVERGDAEEFALMADSVRSTNIRFLRNMYPRPKSKSAFDDLAAATERLRTATVRRR